MKKVIIPTILAMILLLSLGSQALAAPPAQGGEGVLVFGEYGAVSGYYYNPFEYNKSIGVGYAFGLGDVGVQLAVPPAGAPDQMLYGAFAGLNLGPIVINADTLYSQFYGDYYGDVSAALVVNLKVVKLALGGGAEYLFDGALSYDPFAQASVTISALEKLSIYAEAKYLIDSLDLFYSAGFSLVF